MVRVGQFIVRSDGVELPPLRIPRHPRPGEANRLGRGIEAPRVRVAARAPPRAHVVAFGRSCSRVIHDGSE